MKAITQSFMEHNNFSSLTAVQEDVLKHVNSKKDMIVLAPTGTGKTHAFLFSILERINLNEQSLQAVILAPTRELAMQISDFALEIAKLDPRFKRELAIGGMDNKRLLKRLETQPHILISTPGKLQDLMGASILRLDTVKLLIIDEMDMMFDYGFVAEIDNIASRFLDDTQFMLYSATLPNGLNNFINKYLKTPLKIESQEKRFEPNIHHYLVHRRHLSLEEGVLDVLSAINPLLVIVFANTKDQVMSISRYLREYGIESVEIHGDLEDRQRTQIVRRIRSGNERYIIATDLAARGIDLPEVSHVVNANIPTHDLSFYTHRAGRTGRTGREGYCISLVDDSDQNAISRLMNDNIEFRFKRVANANIQDARAFYNFNRPTRRVDPQVVAKLKRKNVKVKPGYKKKHQAKIKKLMQEQKREVIKKDIRRQKKEKAIERQRKMRDE